MRNTRFLSHLRTTLSDIKTAGTYKNERVINTAQKNIISTTTHKDVLNFCSNNYLGFCDDKEIIEKTTDVMLDRGFGSAGTRYTSGQTDLHNQLERTVSEFYQQEDTALYVSCFEANESIFDSLLDSKDAIISDKLNHASIINGIRLSSAKRYLYENNDMTDLRTKLEQAVKDGNRFKMIVTDGVFSMDGNIAKLSQICDLAEEFGAIVFVDECHGTGVLGDKGRGAVELENVLDRVEVISSTFGKAMGGGNGGFITGRKEIVETLKQKSSPILYSTTLAPQVCAGYNLAFQKLWQDSSSLDTLKANVSVFRSNMKSLGFEVLGDDRSAICPVLLKDAKLASDFADEMLNEGIYVIGFSFPVVAKGLARIRVQLSARHTKDDVQRCISAFEKIGRKFKVI